ncbi:MAG: hypothetical protein J6V09_06650, partial [Clostridia bacterium]|nr:hypothetical protein [Clostridia bacterium]
DIVFHTVSVLFLAEYAHNYRNECIHQGGGAPPPWLSVRTAAESAFALFGGVFRFYSLKFSLINIAAILALGRKIY